jgi:hypothetical protein
MTAALHIFDAILWVGLVLWFPAFAIAAVPMTSAWMRLRRSRNGSATFLGGFIVLSIDALCVLVWLLIRRSTDLSITWLDNAMLWAIAAQLAAVPVVVMAVALNNYRKDHVG